MLKKLQQKWKVSGTDFFFILLNFAITGTFTAWVIKSITNWMQVEKFGVAYWSLKLFILFVGYQVFILFFGFCLGRFSFFWNYEKKILQRMGVLKIDKINIAIFASGAGSNAEKIIDRFTDHPIIKPALVVCNKPQAGVIAIAKKNGIPVLIIDKNSFFSAGSCVDELNEKKISWLILAGFLWKIPVALTDAYPGRIINIHPALLPKYGGKGMYGQHVHEAVVLNKETESGITIHYVDEIYDHGKIILQQKCTIEEKDDAAALADKIHSLEHEWYGKTVEEIIIKAKA